MTPDNTPVRRIIATMLAYAIQDGARQIRISPTRQRGLQISFRVTGQEWVEQMKIPQYVQTPLFDELRAMASSKDLDVQAMFSAKMKIEIRWHVQVEFAPHDDGESATITLPPHITHLGIEPPEPEIIF